MADTSPHLAQGGFVEGPDWVTLSLGSPTLLEGNSKSSSQGSRDVWPPPPAPKHPWLLPTSQARSVASHLGFCTFRSHCLECWVAAPPSSCPQAFLDHVFWGLTSDQVSSAPRRGVCVLLFMLSPVPRNAPGGEGGHSRYLWFGCTDRQMDNGCKPAAVLRGPGSGQTDLRAQGQWGSPGVREVLERRPAGDDVRSSGESRSW